MLEANERVNKVEDIVGQVYGQNRETVTSDYTSLIYEQSKVKTPPPPPQAPSNVRENELPQIAEQS